MHPKNTVFMRLLCGAMALSLAAGSVCAEQEVFFHFDEGKGPTVRDASGQVTATLQGENAPEWRSDESGSYLVFDNGDELLIVDSQAVLPRIFSRPSFTVELRVRLDKQEQASSWTELITYLSYRRPVCALEMGRRYGTPHFKVGSVHDHQTVFAMENIGDDEWHHIKLVRDRDLGKFFVFVDGTLENEAPDGIESSLPTNRPRLRLGGDLRGSIDEVRISSEGLPPEIRRQRQAFRWEGLELGRDGILACRHADEPPKVDGLLTDACWDDAEQVLFVQRYKWEPPSQKTVGAALCDEEHLYFAFRCYETNMRELSMEVTDPNGPLYRDDVIEVFLDPQNRRHNYHHLFITAAGVYSDDGTLNRRWQARVRRMETYWTAEVAIPWRSIVERDTENTWIVSLARAERPHRETSCWQPTFGGFNVIKHFGRMVFESVDLRAISRRLHNERFAKRQILAGDGTLEIQAVAGTHKIRRDESVRGLDRIALCAARGESEPFQLLVTPRVDGPLELSIDAEDLVDDGEHRIARTHVSCREIGYLGKVPDVLYPTDQYLGDHGTNRVFWILVDVPRDAVPGDYAGSISVAAGASRFRIPFTLRVWNFALPERVAFKTCLFSAKSSSIVHWYGHPVGTPEFERGKWQVGSTLHT